MSTPPFNNITGISRAVMKDNAQETITGYNGNARPGEIVANLEVDPPTLFIGNNAGRLTQIGTGGGGSDYGNANVSAYLPIYGGNILVDAVVGNTTDNSGYLQWIGNSSGDNNGYTTLHLVPDDTLTSNDQYLIIDPTAPSHIHIRAGGTQDNSQAELYLGGESNYVRVTDFGGIRLQNQTRTDSIYYYSDPADFTTSTWYESSGTFFVEYTTTDTQLIDLTFQFNNDSENILEVYYNAGANTAVLTSAGSVSNLGGGVYRVTVNEAPPSSPTVISAFEYTIWNNSTNSLQLSSNDFTVSVTDDIRITGRDTFSLRNESTTDSITIITDYDNADHTWEFGADGNLTAPGNISTAGSVNTGGNINFTGAESSDTARIFADVAGSTTSLVLEVGDDTADSIVLRHYSFAAGNTIDMLTATRASNTTANVSVAGNVSVGNTLTVSGVAVMSTQAPVGGSSETPTALSLAKSVQILDGSNYSLANGVEGQIMYFVPATGNTRGSAVIVANARRWDYSNTGDAIIEQNLTWFCFDNVIAVIENNDTYAVSMAIFTDGAWNLQGGSKD
jgi:hypothetical protein